MYSVNLLDKISGYVRSVYKKNKKEVRYKDEILRINEIVYDFITSNEVIDDVMVQGSRAINVGLPDNDKLYTEEQLKISDYDIFSVKAKEHAIKLLKKVNEETGYEKLMIKIYPLSYTLVYSGIAFADFTQIDKKVLDLLTDNKDDRGLRYVGMSVLKVRYLQQLVYPVENNFRLFKIFIQCPFYNCIKYPDIPIDKEFKNDDIKMKDLVKAMEYLVKNKRHLIITGDIAYHIYCGDIDYKPEINFVEIIVYDGYRCINDIKSLYGGKYRYKEYNDFVNYGKMFVMYNDRGDVLFVVYEFKKCFNYSNISGYKICPIYFLEGYYLTQILLDKIYNIYGDGYDMRFGKCIYELSQKKGKFNNLEVNCDWKIDLSFHKFLIDRTYKKLFTNEITLKDGDDVKYYNPKMEEKVKVFSR